MTETLRERIAQAIAEDEQGQADAYDPSVQYLSPEFRAGYAAATARAVEVVSEVYDETALKPEAPQVSMEELKERIGAVVDDYTAGEDYGSGPTRYYLTVSMPDELTEHLAAVLFPGLDFLFRAVADWQALWDEKEEWEKAAKEAWQRENVLSWLHAEAVWHAEHHRAQVERLEKVAAEVERLKDVDAEAFAARFQVQSYDIELGRTRRTLARLLSDAGISPPPEGPWHLAHRVKEEFEAVVRQRDEVLAALEKQQAVLADVAAPYRDMLGEIWLYVKWRYVTGKLTTEQRELWADAVDEFGDPQDRGPKAERWWRDDAPAPAHDEVLDRLRAAMGKGAAAPTRKLRLRECVENWPECETGGYNPSCCRFPSSCSATVYDETAVKPEDLEGHHG